MVATRITILSHKIKDKRWDAFTDAFARLNTATLVPISIDTLERALKNAGVFSPDDLPKLLSFTDGQKYLCMSFIGDVFGQTITFSGSDKPFKVKDPAIQ
ncbi:MAG: hypothetical protein ACYSUK_00245 [Planctomycetota bacterium]|jgi:hypothetical protein